MAIREFADSGGHQWRAWDVYPGRGAGLEAAFVDPDRMSASAWLAFDCEALDERRRLQPFPDTWDQLDDAGLRGLCDAAVVVPRPGRLVE